MRRPMDLLEIVNMIKSGKITTVAELEKNLLLTFLNGIFCHHQDHPIAMNAAFAISLLTKLLLVGAWH
jgi:hypothetical protein